MYVAETMSEEKDMNYDNIDCEEIIIHTKDYDASVREKLMDFLRKLGISFKVKTGEIDKGMSQKDVDRILYIEMACGQKHCSPCTYPYCQRFVREQLVVKHCTV